MCVERAVTAVGSVRRAGSAVVESDAEMPCCALVGVYACVDACQLLPGAPREMAGRASERCDGAVETYSEQSQTYRPHELADRNCWARHDVAD